MYVGASRALGVTRHHRGGGAVMNNTGALRITFDHESSPGIIAGKAHRSTYCVEVEDRFFARHHFNKNTNQFFIPGGGHVSNR